MTGAADLDGCAGRELRRVDDGHPFFENRCLGQGIVVGTGPVTGFAAGAGFTEGVLFQIDPGGMASAAAFDPGFFVPGVFVIVCPTSGIDIDFRWCSGPLRLLGYKIYRGAFSGLWQSFPGRRE